MDLLESYIKSIKSYLPKENNTDIANELYENLLSQFNEKEAELKRPLTDKEQLKILKQFGEPMDVAKAYNPGLQGFSFGRQLIGQQLFPGYKKLLLFNLLITAAIICIALFLGLPINVPFVFISLAIQFCCITLLFIILDYVKRKSPGTWIFPPVSISTMFPIQRWQVVSGLVVWSVFTLWWVALHNFPFLLFGKAAGYLMFTDSWNQFYFPIMLLMLAGIMQRSINYLRPDLSWILPVMRFIINGLGVVLQFYMIKAYPFITVSAITKENKHYEKLADTFNGIIFGGVLSWLWAFMLINFIIYGWIIIRHVNRLIINKRKSEELIRGVNS